MTVLKGGLLASGGSDGTVKVSKLDGGEQQVMKGHKGQVHSVVAMGDAFLASAGEDSTVRVWDLDGCALEIVTADERSAIVMIASPTSYGYESSFERVDMPGVHPLEQYGTIPTLGAGATIDNYGRLWWFDPVKNAFICRTPLSS